MMKDFSRGSVVEGVVIRNTSGPAFVPHGSNGITLKNTIAYDGNSDFYWWDGSHDTRTFVPADTSQDLLIDGAIAAKSVNVPAVRGFRLAGFNLGMGTGNKIRNSTAVGIGGTVRLSRLPLARGHRSELCRAGHLGVQARKRCTQQPCRRTVRLAEHRQPPPGQ